MVLNLRSHELAPKATHEVDIPGSLRVSPFTESLLFTGICVIPRRVTKQSPNLITTAENQ